MTVLGGSTPESKDTEMKDSTDAMETSPVPERSEPPGATLFTWVIKDWSKQEDKIFSDEFIVDNDESMKWRLMCFPLGNSEAGKTALYLAIVDPQDQPTGWSIQVNMALIAINQANEEKSLLRSTEHKFRQGHDDWGFPNLMPYADISDLEAGFVVDDTVKFEVIVKIIADPLEGLTLPGRGFDRYNSKEVTGMVGLKNQGATCYMNSLLQTLYHLRDFRRAVYNMPLGESTDKKKQVSYSLQKLFFDLQFGTSSVGTKELTTSFGWDPNESFTQHDVQELNRILQDNLEEKMKGTAVDGEIPRLFEGKIENFLACVNVDYTSTSEEPYYDLSLNVKGCKDVYESFEKYCEVEMMDGDNKYHAEGHGLQDAKKGLHFLKFPPVLNLHLRRFEMDYFADIPQTYKINDRYEFPAVLDLNKYVKEDEQDGEQIFHLFSVLVHSGDVGGGHYYTFIRPDATNSNADWYKFDDDLVTKVPVRAAVDANFGGEDDFSYTRYGTTVKKVHKRYSNAYMLVYLRQNAIDDLQRALHKEQIPPALVERIETDKIEAANAKKQREIERHQRAVRIVLLEDMKKHTSADLVDLPKVRTIMADRTAKLIDVRGKICEELGMPPDQFRLWKFVARQNGTRRPEEGPLTDADLRSQTVESSILGQVKDLAFFVEPIEPGTPPKAKDNVIMFFKVYDPYTETATPVGHAIVTPASEMLHDVWKHFAKCHPWPADEPFSAYEEIKPSMIELIPFSQTLLKQEIGGGDIIVFQKNLEKNAPKVRFPTYKDYMDHRMHRLEATVRPFDKSNKAEDVVIELHRKHSVGAAAEVIGKKLGLDGTHLRLWPHSKFYNAPRSKPGEYDTAIENLLATYGERSNILYYQVMRRPVKELEKLQRCEINFISHNTKTETKYEVFVDQKAIMEDLAEELCIEAKLPLDTPIRFYITNRGKIVREFSKMKKAVSDEFVYMKNKIIDACVIPPEDVKPPQGSLTVAVMSFSAADVFIHFHSNPFYLTLAEDATLGQVKASIQKRLEATDDEAAKWKYHIVGTKSEAVLEDDDEVLAEAFKLKPQCSLGIERPDKTPVSRSSHFAEKTIKIYN